MYFHYKLLKSLESEKLNEVGRLKLQQKKRQRQHRLKWAVKVVGLPVLLQSLSIVYLKNYLNKFDYKLQHKKSTNFPSPSHYL